MTFTAYLLVWVVLSAANIIYAWTTSWNYSEAFERSTFQGFAVLACWVVHNLVAP